MSSAEVQNTDALQNTDAKKLDKLTKKQLVDLILILKEENATLKNYNGCMDESNKFMINAN